MLRTLTVILVCAFAVTAHSTPAAPGVRSPVCNLTDVQVNQSFKEYFDSRKDIFLGTVKTAEIVDIAPESDSILEQCMVTFEAVHHLKAGVSFPESSEDATVIGRAPAEDLQGKRSCPVTKGTRYLVFDSGDGDHPEKEVFLDDCPNFFDISKNNFWWPMLSVWVGLTEKIHGPM